MFNQKTMLKAFLGITIMFAVITGIGVLYSWYLERELPYLHWLLTGVISSLVATVVAYARGEVTTNGVKSLKDESPIKITPVEGDKAINKYMKGLIERGDQLDLFSGALSWISSDIKRLLVKKIKEGRKINFFIPKLNDMAKDLQRQGANIITYEDLGIIPSIRFTVINRDLRGSTIFVISKGAKPKLTIYEFNSDSSPLIIAAITDFLKIFSKLTEKGEHYA